jgi:hypothetical protein
MSTRTPWANDSSAVQNPQAGPTAAARRISQASPLSRTWAMGPLLGALALTGCVVAPVAPAYGTVGVYNDGYITATVAPPAAYYEPLPIAPFTGALWIGGYWDWSGGRHVWRPGHYEHPRPGFIYHPPGWHAGPHGQWMLHRGGWEHGGPGRR